VPGGGAFTAGGGVAPEGGGVAPAGGGVAPDGGGVVTVGGGVLTAGGGVLTAGGAWRAAGGPAWANAVTTKADRTNEVKKAFINQVLLFKGTTKCHHRPDNCAGCAAQEQPKRFVCGRPGEGARQI
jgi:hypothetical protein